MIIVIIHMVVIVDGVVNGKDGGFMRLFGWRWNMIIVLFVAGDRGRRCRRRSRWRRRRRNKGRRVVLIVILRVHHDIIYQKKVSWLVVLLLLFVPIEQIYILFRIWKRTISLPVTFRNVRHANEFKSPLLYSVVPNIYIYDSFDRISMIIWLKKVELPIYM